MRKVNKTTHSCSEVLKTSKSLQIDSAMRFSTPALTSSAVISARAVRKSTFLPSRKTAQATGSSPAARALAARDLGADSVKGSVCKEVMRWRMDVCSAMRGHRWWRRLTISATSPVVLHWRRLAFKSSVMRPLAERWVYACPTLSITSLFNHNPTIKKI